MNLKELGYPDPKDMWGEYSVHESWSKDDKAQLDLWLIGAAASIVFAEQSVINRVNARVKEILLCAKDGSMSAHDCIDAVKPLVLFTKEERAVIDANAEKQSHMMTAFHKNPGPQN
jgi:hypothetical protein